MIVCLRTVAVPADVRDRYLHWIDDGRAVREAHGILAEWVLEPVQRRRRHRGDHGVAVARGVRRLDRHARARRAHRVRRAPAVEYRPITRYDVVGGYTAAALPQEVIR